MPPADLRAALKRAGRKPAACVIGLTKDRQAVILLDRLKKPRKLLGEAKTQAQAAGLDLDLTSLRFGRVSVDGKDAGFTVNKAVAPAAQQAMKAPMRAAGHPRFTVNADPAIEDEPDGPDDTDDATSMEGSPAAPGTLAPAAPPSAGPATAAQAPSPPRPPVSSAVPPDVARGVAAALAADPARRPEFAGLLAQVRAGMDAGDPGAAGRGVAALRQAVDGTPSQAGEGRAAEGRAASPAQPVPSQPAPTSEPHPVPADATLAALARTWAQQGQAGAPGLRSAAQQGSPKAPAPPASKPAASAPMPGGDEDLVTSARAPWVPSEAPTAPPAEPMPVPRPPPGLRPPGAVSPVEGLPPAVRMVGRVAVAVVGGIVANQLNSAGFDSQVVDALARFGLDGSKPADVKAAQAYTYMRIVAPVRFQFLSVPSSDPGNGRVAEAVLRAVQADPDLLDHALAQEQGAAAKLEAVIQGALGGAAPAQPPGQAAPPTAAPSQAGAGAGSEPPLPGTPGLPQAPPPGQELQRPAWLDELNGIETRDDDERRLVEELALGGMKHNDIVNALKQRREQGQGAGRRRGDRNAGLPPELQTDYRRARDVAIKADAAFQAAMAAGTVTAEDVIAHHLMPMEAIRKNLDVFGPAAAAGWRPDTVENLILLPRDDDAQGRMESAMGGERRPVHESGHPDWNTLMLGLVAGIRTDLAEHGLIPGMPAFGQAAKRALDDLAKRLPSMLKKEKVTMNELAENGVG